MPLRNISILFAALAISIICYHRSSHNRYASAIAEAMGQVDDHYVEKVDRRELFEGSMRGMVGELDQYSGFVPASQYQELMEDLDQEFGGVGIIVDVDPDTNRLMVLSPLLGTPAYEAGLRAGDLIMEIDGRDTAGLTANDTVGMIRGQPGTEVRVTVLPLGQQETREVTLVRDIIPVDSVLGDVRQADGTWDYRLEQNTDYAYVRLIGFGEHSAEDLRAALESVVPLTQGLILDLRGNAGGLLEAAVQICDMFLDEGVIVSIRGRGGREQYKSVASGGTLVPPSMPMVVLIDHYSASASEIVAACLQDHGRAKIVGERSWGKGTVQSLFELEGGRSAMRLTTATYWRPSGRNIHRLEKSEEKDEWGVTPDEGYAVPYEQEEYLSVLRARRDRDVVLTRSGAADAGVADNLEETMKDGDPSDEKKQGEIEPGQGTSSRVESTEASEEASYPDAEIESRPEVSPVPDTIAPVIDRQLQKAVDYLDRVFAAAAKAACGPGHLNFRVAGVARLQTY